MVGHNPEENMMVEDAALPKKVAPSVVVDPVHETPEQYIPARYTRGMLFPADRSGGRAGMSWQWSGATCDMQIHRPATRLEDRRNNTEVITFSMNLESLDALRGVLDHMSATMHAATQTIERLTG